MSEVMDATATHLSQWSWRQGNICLSGPAWSPVLMSPISVWTPYTVAAPMTSHFSYSRVGILAVSALDCFIDIAWAQICTSCVWDNTENIVSKTTLMKCQLSLVLNSYKKHCYTHSCWAICIPQQFVWKHACCSLKYA